MVYDARRAFKPCRVAIHAGACGTVECADEVSDLLDGDLNIHREGRRRYPALLAYPLEAIVVLAFVSTVRTIDESVPVRRF